MGEIIICKICERGTCFYNAEALFFKVMGLDKKIENVQKFRVDKRKRAGNSGGGKNLYLSSPIILPFLSFLFLFLFSLFFLRPRLFFPLLFSIPHANNIRSPFGIINPLTHKSEYRLISPLSINPELNKETTRKTKTKCMILSFRSSR